MPQEPFGAFHVNERRKRTNVSATPGVQLNHMVAVINATLKRWRVPHFSLTDARYALGLRTSGEVWVQKSWGYFPASCIRVLSPGSPVPLLRVWRRILSRPGRSEKKMHMVKQIAKKPSDFCSFFSSLWFSSFQSLG